MRMLIQQIGLVVSLGLFCLWSLPTVAKVDGVGSSGVIKPNLVLLKVFGGTDSVEGWLMSEKLDGVRAYWDGRVLRSRNGHVFNAPDWFTANFPPFELDGELWVGRQKFEQVVSIVRQKKAHEGWRKVTYQIFEVPNQEGGLLTRLDVINRYLEGNPIAFIKVIEQVPVNSSKEVKERLSDVLAKGAEGLVLREPNTNYYIGRSGLSLKVKQKQDAECVVTGYTEGKGKYTGLVGALKCRLIEGAFFDLKKGMREIKIGSGLTDLIRKYPPKIGSVVTFQYMGLTAKGLPRFPVYLRDREDYLLSK